MRFEEIKIPQAEVHKLLSCTNADAALLYLYVFSGNDPRNAVVELCMSEARYSCAAATLRQLGMWPQLQQPVIPVGERPRYSETDVTVALERDNDFRALYGEVQRLLGRPMNTEELKILLGFVRYLGMSADVIILLVNYCRERARLKGSMRNPSLRSIEKEAYAWAEQGIDTMEEAAAYINAQNQRRSRISRLMSLLQIRGRNLTPGEEKYAKQWLEWGFEEAAISMAYERTCLNTGGLSWAYMNKILARWQEKGLLTADQIRAGDAKAQTANAPRQLDADERAALARLMEE